MKNVKSTNPPAEGLDHGAARAQALLAASLLAQESAVAVRQARRHVLNARAAARDASGPDRSLVAVVHDWWRGRRRAALNGLAGLQAEDPADLDVAAFASHLAYTEGDVAALVTVSAALAEARPELAFAHALRAFALVQDGKDHQAQGLAERALVLDAGQPLAKIVLADLLQRRGDVAGGIALLERRALQSRGRFWRHALLAQLADLHLRAGHVDDAFDIIDLHLLPAVRTDAHVLQRVISLLWCADLLGADVAGRWSMVGDMVQARWHEHILPLSDLHFIYALARDGREQAVRAFFASMERVGEADNSGLWQSLVIPLARGIVLLARGDHGLAVSAMEPVLPRLHLLGGCRQNREVIRLAFDREEARARPVKVSARRPAEMQVAP